MKLSNCPIDVIYNEHCKENKERKQDAKHTERENPLKHFYQLLSLSLPHTALAIVDDQL